MRIQKRNSLASNPGFLKLSSKKLKFLRPELCGFNGFKLSLYYKILGRFSARSYIKEQLFYGDSRAAVVMSEKPLLVASYSDEFDCIVLLRFNNVLRKIYDLKLYDKLISVNFYGDGDELDHDLIPGPEYSERYTSIHPLIADFLSDDNDRIEEIKNGISEEEWQKTKGMALTYIEEFGLMRDGRPVFSATPALYKRPLFLQK